VIVSAVELKNTEYYLEFIKKFQDCNLPFHEWTHKAHLIVGLFHVLNHKEDSLDLMRERIMKFNTSKGVINSDNSGYHETITIFWLWAIKKFLDAYHKKDFSRETIEALVNSKFAESKFPLNYYTKEHLMSVQARKNWIEPDLKKLD
jgi:hypothetical protein